MTAFINKKHSLGTELPMRSGTKIALSGLPPVPRIVIPKAR